MVLNLTVNISEIIVKTWESNYALAQLDTQSNGAVERANGIICTGVSKCLVGLPKGKWVDELPKVVWAHNTIVSRSKNFTPFKLLYGEEVKMATGTKYPRARG
jgi:hypothetical protein